MSDPKLDPRSLTSEERAIVDALVLRYLDACLPLTDAQLFQRAAHLSVEMIVARRKFFGEPASDPAGVECPECGEMASENHEVVQSDGLEGGRRLFFYTCQQRISELDDRHNRMASPEYQAKVKADMSRRAVEIGMDRLVGITAFPVGNCPTCGELVAPWNKHAKYEGGYSCEPAQPEPVAEEMPEAVRDCISSLVQAAADSDEPDDQFEYQRVAENLESFWRTHAAQVAFDLRTMTAKYDNERVLRERDASTHAAQPAPAVTMSPELALVLDECHDNACEYRRHADASPKSKAAKENAIADELAAAIAAVRAQAEEAGKVRLPKVRELFEHVQHYPMTVNGREILRLAIKEADAAEGRK